MEETRRLNSIQAAKYLGVAPQTLANWRFLRYGPAYLKLRRRVVYLVTDLDKYSEANRIEPEATQ